LNLRLVKLLAQTSVPFTIGSGFLVIQNYCQPCWRAMRFRPLYVENVRVRRTALRTKIVPSISYSAAFGWTAYIVWTSCFAAISMSLPFSH